MSAWQSPVRGSAPILTSAAIVALAGITLGALHVIITNGRESEEK